MTRGRSYTVVGAGAVGLLYGSRLAAAGHPVRWLVRSGADQIRADGIEVATGGDVLRIEPDELEVFTDPRAVPPTDVVLVATKTTANDQLARLVGGACPDGATVVMLQNGLGAEEQVRAQVPQAGVVLGGLCFVCVHRSAPGRAEHLDYGAMTLAPLADEPGAVPTSAQLETAEAIGADLRAAGVETTVLEDLGVARWRKLVWNIPFNGLCTVLDATTDELLADLATRVLVAELMGEVISASHAVGSPVPRAFLDEMLAMTDAMASYDPSMKLDLAAGRRLEIEAIYDAATRSAREAGVPMPRAEMLAAMLRHLDRTRR